MHLSTELIFSRTLCVFFRGYDILTHAISALLGHSAITTEVVARQNVYVSAFT